MKRCSPAVARMGAVYRSPCRVRISPVASVDPPQPPPVPQKVQVTTGAATSIRLHKGLRVPGTRIYGPPDSHKGGYRGCQKGINYSSKSRDTHEQKPGHPRKPEPHLVGVLAFFSSLFSLTLKRLQSLEPEVARHGEILDAVEKVASLMER